MQSTITRQLSASTAATTNAAAQIDIPYRCRLMAIVFNILTSASTPTAGESITAELSVASQGQQGINDAQGILGRAVYGYSITTAGGGNLGVNTICTGVNLLLPPGTRIYLHILQTATSSTRTNAVLYLEPF